MNLHPVKPIDVPGFKIESFAQIEIGESGNADNVLRTFRIVFSNDSNESISTVVVRCKVTINGKVVFTKQPLVISSFTVSDLGTTWGEAVPDHNATAPPLKVDQPSEFWTEDSKVDFEIVSLWAEDQDGKEPQTFDKLYTWFRNAHEEDVLAGIAKWPNLVKIKSYYGTPALLAAYAAGTVAEVKAFSHLPGVSEVRALHGITPLHMAALNGRRPEVLEFARTATGSLDPKNDQGTTPLMYSLLGGRPSNAEWLLAHGARKIAYDELGNPLWAYALSARNPAQMLGILAKADAPLDAPDGKGLSLIHHAVQIATADGTLLTQIAGYGLSANQHDDLGGVTPLMVAAKVQNFAAARWLVQHGARLDAKDKLGRDVLTYAREGNTFRSESFFRREVIAKVKLTKENGVLPRGQG